MKLAIMQPYFFPYIGYFSLMEYADRFVLFDTAQYDRKGWMNRNRVLKPIEGWQYIRANVSKPEYRAPICDVRLHLERSWKDLIFAQIEHYKKYAPHYSDVISLLHQTIDAPYEKLVDINRFSLKKIRDSLGINCPIDVFSEMKLDLGEVSHAGQWALRICEALNADEYVNPPGGKGIFIRKEFEDAGIQLWFLDHQLPEYSQGRKEFIPALSILDVMMFNGFSQIREMLNEYRLLRD